MGGTKKVAEVTCFAASQSEVREIIIPPSSGQLTFQNYK